MRKLRLYALLRFLVAPIRSICVALALAFSLVPAGAFAGDYVVAWAFDAGDKNETGVSADCVYREYCTIKPENSDFDVSVRFRRPGYSVASIRISRGLGCCYFAQGESSVERGTDSLIRLTVFEGRARRGNEYVLNTPVGYFYLQFSDLK
jgi:hypothetical protein